MIIIIISSIITIIIILTIIIINIIITITIITIITTVIIIITITIIRRAILVLSGSISILERDKAWTKPIGQSVDKAGQTGQKVFPYNIVCIIRLPRWQTDHGSHESVIARKLLVNSFVS